MDNQRVRLTMIALVPMQYAAELLNSVYAKGAVQVFALGPADGEVTEKMQGTTAPARTATKEQLPTRVAAKEQPPAREKKYVHVNKQCVCCGQGYVATSNGAKYCPSCKAMGAKGGRTNGLD